MYVVFRWTWWVYSRRVQSSTYLYSRWQFKLDSRRKHNHLSNTYTLLAVIIVIIIDYWFEHFSTVHWCTKLIEKFNILEKTQNRYMVIKRIIHVLKNSRENFYKLSRKKTIQKWKSSHIVLKHNRFITIIRYKDEINKPTNQTVRKN